MNSQSTEASRLHTPCHRCELCSCSFISLRRFHGSSGCSEVERGGLVTLWDSCPRATELFCSFSVSYEIGLGVRHLEAQKGKGGDSR